ncbi:glucosaminidase domain-containing protein [Holdemanella biformis]
MEVRIINKKIAAYILSVMVLCGGCVMTIEGEMRNEILRNNERNAEISSMGSSDEVNPENITSGVSVNVQFGKYLDNSIRTLVASGCDVENRCSSNMCDSGGEHACTCLEDGNKRMDDISLSDETSEVIAGGSNQQILGNTVNQIESVYGAGTIESKIVEACNRYGIDSSVVLGIARLETGNFTSYAYLVGNNPGGMSVNEVPIIYSNIEEGVEAMVSNLAHNYFAIGLTTPELIGQKYCPVNPNWAYLVRNLM